MQPIIQLIGSGAIGGGTTAVLALSQGLAERGRQVVVASQRGSYLINAARDSGLATLELDFDRRSSTPRLAMCLGRAVRDLKPSMIHAHGARAGLPAALVPFNIPFVYTVHGFHYPGKPFGLRALARQTERFCIYRAAATVFVSNHDCALAASDAVMAQRSPHLVIHNGTSTVGIPDQTGARPVFDIAFLGRLHPQKNPLALVDILLALRPLEPTLAIIGTGECEAALRERLQQAGVAHQVRFLGLRPSSEALALLAQARVMVLTSVSEGLPVAVIEAMHLGVPTVASNVGGLGELLDDGNTGFLVRPDDITGFADRLRCLLLDESRRLRMGRLAQERAQSAFSIQLNLERHLGLYSYLTRQPRSNAAGLIMAEQLSA